MAYERLSAFKTVLLIAVLLALYCFARKTSGAEPLWQPSLIQSQELSLIQNTVAVIDASGNITSVETHAAGGVCITEVKFIDEQGPLILVTAIYNGGLRHLGLAEVNDEVTHDHSGPDLLERIKRAITEHCAPFIVPDYTET